MKIEHKLLTPGPCGICNRTIIEQKKPNKFYAELIVTFNDDSKANFAVCKECKNSATREQVERLVSDQIFSWGQEIVKQQLWYINTAVHLRLKEYGP